MDNIFPKTLVFGSPFPRRVLVWEENAGPGGSFPPEPLLLLVVVFSVVVPQALLAPLPANPTLGTQRAFSKNSAHYLKSAPAA